MIQSYINQSCVKRTTNLHSDNVTYFQAMQMLSQ